MTPRSQTIDKILFFLLFCFKLGTVVLYSIRSYVYLVSRFSFWQQWHTSRTTYEDQLESITFNPSQQSDKTDKTIYIVYVCAYARPCLSPLLPYSGSSQGSGTNNYITLAS